MQNHFSNWKRDFFQFHYCNHWSKFLLIATFFIMHSSCFLYNRLNRFDKVDKLSQKAIFTYLGQVKYLSQSVGEGKIMIDSLLHIRDTIIFNGGICLTERMRSNDLKYPLSRKIAYLTIPDTLIYKYRYAPFKEDYGFNRSLIHQFSPLLPALEPNIYLMEHYFWQNFCMDGRCLRAVKRNYLKFKIENKEIYFMEEIRPANEYNYCGHAPIEYPVSN